MQRQAGTLPGMHRRASLKIGQREVGLPVAAVGGAEQREEGRVLRQGQKLPVAPCPPFGSEVEGEDSDFGYEWIHVVFSFSIRNPELPPAPRLGSGKGRTAR